jgi:methyl-accepting chemotaxis protein
LKSMKTQLMVSSLFIALIPFVLANVLSYYLFSRDIENNTKQDTLFTAKTIANRVQNFIDKSFSINEILANNSDVVSFDPVRQDKALKDVANRFPYIDLIYVQGTNGMQTAKTKGTLGDRSQRWWFKKFMQEKEPFVSKSYYSISSGSSVTSIFHGIYRDSQLLGILGTDFKLSSIQKDIEKDFQNSSEQAIVLDNEGVVIAHPDNVQVSELYNYLSSKKTILKKDANGNPLKDEKGNEVTEEQPIDIPQELKVIAEKGLKGEEGISEYTDANGDTIICAFHPIKLPGKSANWLVITTENKNVALSHLHDIIVTNSLVALVVILLVVLVIYLASQRLAKPIIEMDRRIKQVANGNLNVSMDGIKATNREMAALTNHMNDMIHATRTLVRTIQEKSQLVKRSSSELFQASDMIAGSTEQIVTSIQEVASSAEMQARSFADTATAMEEMSLGIQRITESASVVQSLSEDASKEAAQGNESIQRAISQMAFINDAVEESSSAVQQLVEKSREIDRIIEVITEISNQTNLLALNAAIEAARAGEHGKGFSVVADEVRKLAEQSNLSAEQISRLVKDILSYTDRTVQSMHHGKQEVERGKQVVADAGEKFMHILHVVRKVAEQVQEVSAAIEQMSATSEEITATVDNLLQVVQDTSDSTQTISRASVQQAEKMENIRQSISDLDALAKELQDEIKKFIV